MSFKSAVKHSPTPEQAAILSAVAQPGTNILINAYAGTGKTTTLEMLSSHIPEIGPKLAIAFNKSIQEELEKRFPKNFTVKTFNGLGHSAWGKAIGKRCEVVQYKLSGILREMLKGSGQALPLADQDNIRSLCTAAMHAGLVPSKFPNQGLVEDQPEVWRDLADAQDIEASPFIIDFARSLLIESIRASLLGSISYDDQIYMSALFNGDFPRQEVVLVDEAQDLSPLNHRQIKKCLSPSSRLIVCGDPLQAIYAFRGADSQSMRNIQGLRKEWTILPLATTFRCPKIIVDRQQTHAPGYTAWHGNPSGLFLPAPRTDGEGWMWRDVEAIMAKHSLKSVSVICRNNAPIIGLAFKLIRQRIPVTVLGRDIGTNLVTLARKICPEPDTSLREFRSMIKDWEATQTAKAELEDKPHKIAGIKDRAECLIAVCDFSGLATAGDCLSAISSLFSPKASKVTLSSIHKSKGLEYDLVIHLDPYRVPSKYAIRSANPAALVQEHNLKYVLETRAKFGLVEATMESFQ